MKKRVPALRDYEFKDVEPNEVDYQFHNPRRLWGAGVNMIPLQNNVAGARLFYGARFFNQALPIVDGEEPLVQNEWKDGVSFDQHYGETLGAVRSQSGGKVSKVTPDFIELEGDEGKRRVDLYNNFFLNRKTRLHNTPLVKAGDSVEPGQVLAKSNYTNERGINSMGLNARIALVPWRGYSMDDAVVVSEDFAKRLKSDHGYTFDLGTGRGVKSGKGHYVSVFPNTFKKEQLEKLDDSGVVKPGTVVQPGDPLILATKPRVVSSESAQLGKLSKYLKDARNDNSIIWEHEKEGTVQDVVKTRDGWKVNVSAQSPASVGDKIVIRSGQKGIISKIIPSEQMPRTKDGEALEVLLNPLGIPSRVNPSLNYELILGKIAKKRGEPFVVPGFEKGDRGKWLREMMKKYDISETEEIYDPVEDRLLENPVSVGNAYVMKLHHTIDSKMSARAQGAYSLDHKPLKGGDESAKAQRVSGLEMTALLSAGAYGVGKDVTTTRGTRNDEYWRAIRSGANPQHPGSPFAWDKFNTLLMGGGFYGKDLGDGTIRMGPITDRLLDQKKPIEVKNGELIDINNLKPIDGGLFDPTLTVGNRWGKISLPYPLPNPAFEGVALKMLNLREKDFRAIMRGEREIEDHGTGPDAILSALNALDLKQMKKEAESTIKSGPRSKRGLAVKRLGFIRGMERNQITPSDLFITKVPVIPPQYRPYAVVGDVFMAGDLNELYRDLIQNRDSVVELGEELGEESKFEGADNLYDSVRALYGFGKPTSNNLRNKDISGFMQKLIGGNAKYSFPQRNLFSSTVDNSGRSTITVDPQLGLDEVGVPKEMAWKIFAPYIQRELSKRGFNSARAVSEIENRSEIATHALNKVIGERPVMYTRSPAWHRHSTVGGWAKLHDGRNIRINSLVTSGLGADFDGDTMSVHVPSLDEAVKGVKEKLFPSRQITSARDYETVVNPPKHESILGLFAARTRNAKNRHVFNTRAEALQAIRTGKISLSDEIDIVEEQIEAAQQLANRK